ITTFVIAVCAALAFSSCETLDPDKDFSGTPYGFWIVDKLEVEVGTTINGTTTTHKSTTDFSGDYCRLNLDTSLMASLWYNFDLDLETFLYDASATRITFRESLNAGDNGKAIVLLGVYDVTLDGDTMVLSQPEAAVGVLGFGASEKATYYLHRAPKSEKPRETTDD
ncbi:MAG: hypothetical protein IKX29_04410, partial [Bacteroidales bacterium]|nr:hypothetical protein [Bacteroidales bacterium]